VVGTTDTPVASPSLEPRPQAQEIELLLVHIARYLTRDPAPDDVLSCFAGLRPLVHRPAGKEGGGDTATLSRDHSLVISPSGLVTITGGKWTTYRRMGEDTIDHAAALAGLPEKPSVTAGLSLHGWIDPASEPEEGTSYGADTAAVDALAAEQPSWSERLHPRLPYRICDAVWAVRHEMARTVEKAACSLQLFRSDRGRRST
jgi:glycerol-3-phosphate dehydrogenase